MHSNIALLARMLLPLVAQLSACGATPAKPESPAAVAVDASKLAVFACMTASPIEAWRWTGSTQQVLIYLAADGSVSKAEVAADLIADETYLQCVSVAVSSLLFPASTAPTSFELGFPIGRYDADGRPLRLNYDELDAAISSLFPWIRQCPVDVTGQVQIHFSFGSDGSPRDFIILSPKFVGSAAADCVIQGLQKLYFRPLDEELEVMYPFTIGTESK